MARKHWTPDAQGMVRLYRCGEPVLVSVSRLDAIAAGDITNDFYMEWAAAMDLPLDPEQYVNRGGKTGRSASKHQHRKRTTAPAADADTQLALI